MLLVAEQWGDMLNDHPDRHLVQYILLGIRDGFRIGFNRGYKCKRATGNMRTAIMNSLLDEEFLKSGTIIGPLYLKSGQTGYGDIIAKQGQPGKWRLILDL